MRRSARCAAQNGSIPKLPSTNPILTDPPPHPTMSAVEDASTVVIINRPASRLLMSFGQHGCDGCCGLEADSLCALRMTHHDRFPDGHD
jgi:hypothetical protein